MKETMTTFCRTVAILLGGILCVGLLQAETLSPDKRAALRNALDKIGVHEYELGFDKLWVEDDTFRLSLIDTLMNRPLALPKYGDNF